MLTNLHKERVRWFDSKTPEEKKCELCLQLSSGVASQHTRVCVCVNSRPARTKASLSLTVVKCYQATLQPPSPVLQVWGPKFNLADRFRLIDGRCGRRCGGGRYRGGNFFFFISRESLNVKITSLTTHQLFPFIFIILYYIHYTAWARHLQGNEQIRNGGRAQVSHV